MMTLMNNVGCLVFLLLPNVPDIGVVLLYDAADAEGHIWANWALVSGCVVSVLLIGVFREKYHRLEIDTRPL
jgi:hypothetical protein